MKAGCWMVPLALLAASCGTPPARQMPEFGGDGASERPRTTTAVDPSGPSRDMPLRVGAVARVGDWVVRVVGVDPNGTNEILAHNQFNEPPAEGSQFFVADVEATYLGEGSAALWLELGLTAMGPDGTPFPSFDPSCGVIPGHVRRVGHVFPGGTVVGAACWVVDSTVADDLVMEASDRHSHRSENTALFSLDPGAAPVEATTVPSAMPPLGFEAVPLGETAELKGWEVTVVTVNADAADVVLGENQFNDPPNEGNRYIVVELSVRRSGDTAASFTADVATKPVGSSRRLAYEGMEAWCGVIPDPLSAHVEIAPGSVVSGNLCWEVAVVDLSTLVLVLTESATAERAHLALTRR